jgi:hypothetical protein
MKKKTRLPRSKDTIGEKYVAERVWTLLPPNHLQWRGASAWSCFWSGCCYVGGAGPPGAKLRSEIQISLGTRRV